MPRNALTTRKKTRRILKSFSIEKQEFGVHWDEVKRSRYDGSLSDDGFEKLCMFLQIATTRCGLNADCFSRHYMKKPLAWRFSSVEKKAVKLCDKVRRHVAKRQIVVEYYPAQEQDEGANRPQGSEGQEGADRPQGPEGEQTGRSPPNPDGQRQQPIDPWDPPMVAIGENALDGYNAVSYNSWLGPKDMRLREEPSKNQRQALLDFNVGKKLFPRYLLEASAEERYNWHETVVCFDKAASEAQIPLSLPEPYRAACMKMVKSCNPRRTPSQQKCYTNIERSMQRKEPIYLADMVAMLCFVHYCVGETGRNKWLWKKLKAAHLLKCAEYEFDWSNIVDGVIYNGKGRSMAKRITTQGPQRRRSRS